MALAYTNIEVELREISLRDRPQALYSVSQKGTVPVLITNDDIIIDESLDIILWALKNDKDQTWLSENSDNKMELITINDTTFKKWLDRYKYHDRYPENSKDYYKEKCAAILSEYDKQLCNTKYLSRDEISITDIVIFPFIRQFANVDYQWFESNYTHLENWLNNISSSDLFISVMEKYNTWNEKDEPQIINFNN